MTSPPELPHLRAEVRPLEFAQLTNDQRKAFELIVACLKEASDDLSNADPPKPAFANRKSRIFFVSGESGTGKSTISMSIRSHTDRQWREKNTDIRLPAATPLSQDLADLETRLLWLEPLDLEPLAGDANFLAAVLARVESAVEEHDDLLRVPSRRGLLALDENASKAIEDLRRLATDLALSWRSHIRERALHVDPDTYAAELRRGEKARLNVTTRVQSTLRGLAQRLSKGRDDMLFVLPVDDVYDDPASSFELLRLLRMVSVPHLFVLITGDLDVLRELLYHQHLGDLIRITTEAGFRQLGGEHDIQAHIPLRARSLAEETIEKLLPPKQRATLPPLEWKDALKFQIDARESLTLRGILNVLPGSKDETPPTSRDRPSSKDKTLPTLLDRLDFSWSERDEKKPEDGPRPYTGRYAFEIAPRRLNDLARAFDQIGRDPGPRIYKLLRTIADEFLHTLREQNWYNFRELEYLVEPSSDFGTVLLTPRLRAGWFPYRRRVRRFANGATSVITPTVLPLPWGIGFVEKSSKLLGNRSASVNG